MGKFSIERWRCDRCHAEAPKWIKPGSAHSIVCSVDYGTAGGMELEWRELCAPCNDLLGRLVEGMKRDALEARAHLQGASHDQA